MSTHETGYIPVEPERRILTPFRVVATAALAGYLAFTSGGLERPNFDADTTLVHALPDVPAGPPASKAEIITLQNDMNQILPPLGMNKLAVDGNVGINTQDAICAMRMFSGSKPSRTTPTSLEVQSLLKKDTLSYRTGGLVVNLTCQVMGVNLDNKLSNIFPITSGKPGKETPAVNGAKVYKGIYGWHDSTLTPSETGEGNMQFPLYYKGPYAIHGSRAPEGQSNGCIRVSMANAMKLWQIAGGPAQGKREDVFKPWRKKIPVTIQK